MMQYIPFILFTAAANAVAQIFLKYGMNSTNLATGTALGNILNVVFNPWVMAGLVTYVIAMGSHLYSLTKVDLSFAYPFLSLTYVIVAPCAVLLFKEEIGLMKAAGILCICLGTVLISQGEANTNKKPEIAAINLDEKA